MDYEKDILIKLVSIYEKRGYFQKLPDKTIRAISINIGKEYEAYTDRHDSFVYNNINDAVYLLIKLDYVTAEQDNLGYYSKVTMNIGAIDKIYSYINKRPKEEIITEQKQILLSFADNKYENSVLSAYCSDQIRRLEQNKELDNSIGDDVTKLKKVLTALDAIMKLKTETYIRNFSEAVFYDSKEFQKIKRTVSSIIKKYSSEPFEEDDNVLEWFNLFENPKYLYVKGHGTIFYGKNCLELDGIRGGIAISPDSIEDISEVSLNCGVLMTVENLTTYHDTSDEDRFVIYLGGFHNSVRTNLLKKIYDKNCDKKYYHRGDIDIFGFLILENLISKTGIPFEAYDMDLEILKDCYNKKFVKPLTQKDIKNSKDPQLNKYKDVIEFMLQNNCKAEQECFEAMKLSLN